MPFDLGAFVSVLAGGAIAVVLASRLLDRVGVSVDEDHLKTLEGLAYELQAKQRQLGERLTRLEEEVGALKLDVAELHDVLHRSLSDQRSEMEDWD